MEVYSPCWFFPGVTFPPVKQISSVLFNLWHYANLILKSLNVSESCNDISQYRMLVNSFIIIIDN